MARTVKIFDTTLRDGEQSPGCSMNLNEKIEVARQLDAMGVDVIEAGFAIASPGDAAAIAAIADTVKNAVVCSLARCTEKISMRHGMLSSMQQKNGSMYFLRPRRYTWSTN